jgi:DNA-binding NtrC family response regulator
MVLDLILPGMHGLRVLKEVKAKRPEIKSIIITAYPTDQSQAEAKKFGAIDYLTKPVFPVDLEKVIRETLAKWEGAE